MGTIEFDKRKEQRRIRPRRQEDRETCGAHSLFEYRIEEIKQANEKIESRLEKFVSKYTIGIIITICTTLLGVLLTIGILQLETINDQISNLSESIVELSKSVAVLEKK